MEIRNNLEALRTLMGGSTPVEQGTSSRAEIASDPVLSGDKATLSASATAVSQAVDTSDVRMEKVMAVQAAIVSGNYSVSAGSVADKMVDTMLSPGAGIQDKGK